VKNVQLILNIHKSMLQTISVRRNSSK